MVSVCRNLLKLPFQRIVCGCLETRLTETSQYRNMKCMLLGKNIILTKIIVSSNGTFHIAFIYVLCCLFNETTSLTLILICRNV